MWLNDMIKQVTSFASKFISSALNEDERYAKSIITCLAAVTYADGIVEDEEMLTSYGFIEGMDEIKSSLGEDRAKEVFAMELDRFDKMAKMCGGKLSGPVGKMELKKVAGQIVDDVPDANKRLMVLAVAEQLADSDDNRAPEEDFVIQALKEAMR